MALIHSENPSHHSAATAPNRTEGLKLILEQMRCVDIQGYNVSLYEDITWLNMFTISDNYLQKYG